MSQLDPDRTTLDAFVDGELPASEMTRIAAVVAKRPDLRRYVEDQERLRRTLQASLAPLMSETIPAYLQQSVHAAAIPPMHKTAWSDRLQEFFSWRALAPATAALALGLLVGIAVERFGLTERALLRSTPSGQTVAQGELARVLSEQLASSQSPNQSIRVGLSFRSKGGSDCRTFSWDGSKNSMSGIACHSNGEWVVATLATEPPNANPKSQYRMAGAGLPDAIRSAVKDMISGQPFDASAERAARASHWAGADSP